MTKAPDLRDWPNLPWLFSSRDSRRVPEPVASKYLVGTDVSRVANEEGKPYRHTLTHPHRHRHMQDTYGFGLFIVGDGFSSKAALAMAGLLCGRRPNYVFVDIWDSFIDAEAPVATAKIVAQLQPLAAGWWGQELAFGLWCRRLGLAPSISALQQFSARLNVPIVATEGYFAFCRDVIDVRLSVSSSGRGRLRRWLSARLEKFT